MLSISVSAAGISEVQQIYLENLLENEAMGVY